MTFPYAIKSGSLLIYHLFEVADLIQLNQITTFGGKGTIQAHISYKKPIPGYLQFITPPLLVGLGNDEFLTSSGKLQALRLKAKLYEYGIISVIMEADFSGSWEEFRALGRELIGSSVLEEKAAKHLNTIITEIKDALVKIYPVFHFSEDYVIFQINEFDKPVTAEELLIGHSGELARLMRGEEVLLGAEEEKEVLRHRFSYGKNDLVIVDWNTAFIYDMPEEAYPLTDILEYANSQLLELRYYDSLLDSELNAIYTSVLPKQQPGGLLGRSNLQRTAEKLMILMIEITELTERIENGLKIIGDIYYARIYRAAAQRLSLKDWENNIDNKIRIINTIYNALISRIYASRSIGLEILVVLLILIEVIIFIVAEFK